MNVGRTFVCSELGFGTTSCSRPMECCFGMMYVEWYGVSDFVVFFVVEVCIGYGGVYVFQVCFDVSGWVMLCLLMFCC